MAAPKPVRKRRRLRLSGVALWQFCVRETCSVFAKIMSLVVYAALLFVVTVDGSEIWIPALQAEMQSAAGEGAPEISVGAIGLTMGADAAAGVTLSDVEVSQGEMVVHLPKVTTSLGVAAGFQGQLRPQDVTVEGGALRFRREPGGRLMLSAGQDEDRFAPILAGGSGDQAFDLGGVLDAVGALSSTAMLSELVQVDLRGIEISFLDARNGARWETEDARAALEREGDTLRASLRATFEAGRNVPLKVAMRMHAPAVGGGETRLQMELDGARPSDLASQFRALDWMTLIDAEVSGDLALVFDPEGRMTDMSGTLTLGPGAIAPPDGARIPFAGAKGYMSYDPEADRITVDGLEVKTSFGAFGAEGEVYLTRGEGGAVDVLTTQMRLPHLTAQPPHISRPVDFGAGRLMGRVFVKPFRIEIGDARFSGPLADVSLSGRVRPMASGWDVALDAKVAEIEQARVMELWPEGFRKGVRKWLTNHVNEGLLRNVEAHLRMVEGKPDIAFGLDFAGADVSILHTMPPVRNGAGRVEMAKGRLDLILHKGVADAGSAAPGGREINFAGTRFEIADLTANPVWAKAEIAGSGEIGAFLALIDHAPLRVMERAGWGADLAEGRGRAVATLELPLLDGLKVADVAYAATAEVFDLRSTRIVPGRVVEGEQLALSVTPEMLDLVGPVRLNDVPLDVRYRRAINGNPEGQARISGRVPVTAETVAGLGIDLPNGALGGRGSAQFTLDLRDGSAPRYRALADLGSAAVAVPALKWRKQAGRGASLELRGRLGASPSVDALVFEGPGLKAEGALELGAGGLAAARLTRLQVGRWLDAAMYWRPASGGDAVEIRGGTLDLRYLPERAKGAGGQGSAMQLSISPDTVRVTDTIRLTGFSGRLSSEDGGRGRFSARVNGGAEVTGVVRDGGTVYLQARDGGRALADAKILKNISGGTLRVSLTPLAPGIYDGRFSLQEARAINAPLLANLLAVTNLFGLLDRLGGAGIGFEDAQGWFTLSKDQITITRARAVGATLGVTLSGSYDTSRDQLNMEGVVSPMYALNGLPARIPVIGRLFGGRDGEGLLGATFQLTGKAGAPSASVNPLSLLTPGAAREIFMTRPALQPAGPAPE